MLDSVLRAYIPSHAQGRGWGTNVVPRIKPSVSHMQGNSLDDPSSSNLKKNPSSKFLELCNLQNKGTSPRDSSKG